MTAKDERWGAQADELGAGTLVDAWRVVERLGAGGYGAVYKVEHVAQPGAFYALKLALNRSDKRTEREEQLLMGKAVHPNVVRLHAIGRWPHPVNGNPYFVMSWVDGLALDVWAETLNPSFRQLAEKAGKVALALGALHARGVLHRDLKPEHILIRESDGEPILIDLGVGYVSGADTLTMSVLPPATPYLLSPEAVAFLRTHDEQDGERYQTKPTDELHALGVLLYRVVTGQYPYNPDLPLDLLYSAIESAAPTAPSVLNPRVPGALSDILQCLLAKDPRERFQTGQQLHDALLAATAIGHGAVWDASLFAREAVPPAEQEQGAAQRPELTPESTTAEPPPAEPKHLFPMFMPWRLGTESALDNAWALGALRQRLLERPSFVVVAALVFSFLGAKVLGLWPFASLGAGRPDVPLVSKLPVGLVGQEVAQQVGFVETAFAAVPPEAVPTPAVVAGSATHVEDEASVKNETVVQPSTPTPQGKSSRLDSLSKALCVGAASAALACASVPVRTDPPSEPCPPGAREAMDSIGLTAGSSGHAAFLVDGKEAELYPMPVTEGPFEAIVTISDPSSQLPKHSILSGRLIFGETRVHGWVSRIRSPDGKLDIPACIVLGEDSFGLHYRNEPTAPNVATSDHFMWQVVRQFRKSFRQMD